MRAVCVVLLDTGHGAAAEEAARIRFMVPAGSADGRPGTGSARATGTGTGERRRPGHPAPMEAAAPVPAFRQQYAPPCGQRVRARWGVTGWRWLGVRRRG